jgi:phosphoenolpyruvate synthase/pyruvate phosphate dikinase
VDSGTGRAFIEWLGSADGGAEALGGKGASLDRLGRMGFRIPPGFCLTTAAFRRQLAAIGATVIDEGIAGRVEGSPLADDVAAALRTALTRLTDDLAGGGSDHEARLAVRSSAIGEDGQDASYAGLHETELGVLPAGVDGAVRRCWASLWSPPALAYRIRRALPLDAGAMAVVVQALVPADAAVVAFTRHPVTRRADQLVINAAIGLGEAMVSGTVTPDTFVVDRASHSIVEYTPGDGASGGRVIDGSTFGELVELILRVEAAFGAPVDVEAAVSGGTWYVLQARPITTGAPISSGPDR